MADKISIEVLEDGTISVTTEGISGTNHMSADKFLETINDMAGGEVQKSKTRASHAHVHQTTGKKIWHKH